MKRMVQKGVLSLLVLAMVISPALAVSSFPDVRRTRPMPRLWTM